MAMLRIRRLTQALEMRSRRLAKLATVDALTGLLNRRTFDERLPEALKTAQQTRDPVSVLMIDVDHFKQVNDVHGHDAGDQVLAFLGHIVDEVSRENDLAFRYGGEEFSLVAPDTGAEQAIQLAEEFRNHFEVRSAAACRAGRQTLSIGISSTDHFGGEIQLTPALLVRAADMALYQAKRDGRNRVACFEPVRMLTQALSSEA
jgi:diguanylate cyclase (GGDEF)-like protein